MNKSTNEFLKTVRLAFPVFRKKEKRFYRDFKVSVYAYAEQFPACSLSDLYKHFGEPEDIVNTYFENMEDSIYYYVTKRVYYLKTMTVSVIVFLSLMFVATFGFLWHSKNTYQNIAIHAEGTNIEKNIEKEAP